MSHQLDRKKTRRRMTFLIVGAFNTLMDFCFYTLLTQTVLSNQEEIATAGLISGIFALLCAFLTHRYITWKERPVDNATVLRFFIFTGLGMWLLRPVLLALFIHMQPVYKLAHELSSALNLPFEQDFISKTGAFGFMAVILLIYNFATYDRYVFRSNKDSR